MNNVTNNQKQLQNLLKNISRIEIIDQTGRVYVNWLKEGSLVISQLQDNERTLKLFLKSKKVEDE